MAVNPTVRLIATLSNLIRRKIHSLDRIPAVSYTHLYRTGSITGYSKGRNLRAPDCEDKPAYPGSCFRYGVMDRIRAQVL